MASVLSTSPTAAARRRRCRPRRPGYGDLVEDPFGIIDLPDGFRYRVLSQEGDALTNGDLVPSSHDGMAAFPTRSPFHTVLVRNHEIDVDDVEEDGLIPVCHRKDITYDPDGVGGTTTLVINRRRELVRHHVSLAGTLDNCAGGPTPWRTWLTCEETTDILGKPHGYVFEVHPRWGGNPEPIVGMGRFEHEAVAFDCLGRAYLTEDADGPHGCLYRFTPNEPHGGCGSLHAGGELEALSVVGLDTDLSIIQEPGTLLDVCWVPVANPDPGENDTPVREQAIAEGATPIQKCEGIWRDEESIWFVSSRGDGPNAEDEEDISAAEHAGQIWRYYPQRGQIELVVIFERGTPYDEPDNITVGPHGFALACTDGEDDQWLVGIDEAGQTFPFAFNALNDEEFAGATFSPDGRTLFVNIQGPPGMTLAIWGPWQQDARFRRWRRHRR